MKKLFLDDVRTIEMVYDKSLEKEFDIVRNYLDFVAYIQENGLPDFISFDNDLGLDEHGNVAPDGYAAAKWLVYESNLDIKWLRFKVHSANPVASEQIKGLLNNYQRHMRNEALINSIKEYCSTITETNFSKKYEGFRKMMIQYNELGMSRSIILKALDNYLIHVSVSEWIEEIVSDFLKCAARNSHPNHVIELKEY